MKHSHWLHVESHVTSFNHSDCIIQVTFESSLASLNFVCEINSCCERIPMLSLEKRRSVPKLSTQSGDSNFSELYLRLIQAGYSS